MEQLTTLFVVPSSSSLPTSGTNANLSGTQFGMFLPNLQAATLANVSGAAYLTFSQGRNIYTPEEGTKDSDKVYPSNLLKEKGWYKVVGSAAIQYQITEISGFNLSCNEDVSITLRLDSFYIRTAYFNGLTRSVMVTTPCCNCGSNPCDTLQAADIQATVSALAEAINQDEILSQFVTAGTNGTGASTNLVIEGNPLTVYANNCDLTNFPYQYDRMDFWTFVRTGPDLSTDYEVDDRCNTVATVSILQRSSYVQGTGEQVQQLEKNYWSYQSQYKDIFSNPNYNGEYQSYVDASVYDLFYLRFYEPKNIDYTAMTAMPETVIIAIPQGDPIESSITAILYAMYGLPQNETSTPSTTTTITTSSTTTSTTTFSPTP